MFAGVLFDYISLNLETYINKSQNLFEKPREVRDDWIMKFNLIETYNKMNDRLVSYEDKDGKFELGVVCDTLLDLIRY
jgi:hypothetical protein